MKLLLKFLIVGLVLNAAARVGMAQYRFYVFEDAVQQEALFSQRMTPQQLANRVAELAEQQELPLDPDRITVNFTGPQATVTASYTERLELLPRMMVREWPFDLRVTARRMP
jgi:hypothetical protein